MSDRHQSHVGVGRKARLQNNSIKATIRKALFSSIPWAALGTTWTGLMYSRGREERRAAAASPIDTRVLPIPVFAPHIQYVGKESGTDAGGGNSSSLPTWER